MGQFDELDDIFEELGNAEALFEPAAGSTIGPVKGIFETAYIEVGLGMAGIEGSNPTFTCAATSVSAADGTCPLQENDTVRIATTLYLIQTVRADGDGTIAFDLQEA